MLHLNDSYARQNVCQTEHADQLSRVQLETAATAGVVVVLAVIGIVMYEAISAGLPGLASGDVPIWSLKVRCAEVHHPTRPHTAGWAALSPCNFAHHECQLMLSV